MRSVRSEVAIMLTVLAVPAVVALSFPYAALSFRPIDRVASTAASSAWVVLSAAEERLALRRARSSWRGDAGDVRSLHADLSVDELPVLHKEQVFPSLERTWADEPARIGYSASPLLPTRAACAPAKIEVDEGPAAATFDREEMLRITRQGEGS